MPEATLTPQPGYRTAPLNLVERPVFLIGAPRGGTTWLQRMLLEHPAICGGQESHFFALVGPLMRSVRYMAALERPVGLACYWSIDDLDLEIHRLWWRTMSVATARKPGATILLEKTPDHTRFQKEVLTILPESRFVHLIRDSRAVVSSLLAASKEPWGKDWAPDDPVKAAMLWREFVHAGLDCRNRVPPGDYMHLHYEDLHTNTVRELQRVFEFLGLAVDPSAIRGIADHCAIEKQQATGGSRFVTCGGQSSAEPANFLRRGSPDGWRQDLTAEQQQQVWNATANLMLLLGYDREGRHHDKPQSPPPPAKASLPQRAVRKLRRMMFPPPVSAPKPRSKSEPNKEDYEFHWQRKNWVGLFRQPRTQAKVLEYWRTFRHLDDILRLTALNERSCILDLGCGISTVLHFLPGERWGIDPLGDRYRTIYRYPDGVRVSKGYGESIPFPDAHFDAVFCSNCIDHMTDSKQAVREVQRVLKPNGFFVLTCEVFSSDLGVRNEGHPHSLTRDSFFALLRDFEVLASWDSVWHGLQRYVTGSPPTEQREFIAVARRGAKAAEG